MKERLALLLQAEVISQKAHDNCLRAIAMLDSELGLTHNNEQYQMAVTHLSRAADRIWQDDAIQQGLDVEILDEIYQDKQAQIVLDLHHKVLATMGIDHVPTNEEGFLIANIYALLKVAQPLAEQV